MNDLKTEGNADLEIVPSWAQAANILDLPRSTMLSQEYIQPIKSISK